MRRGVIQNCRRTRSEFTIHQLDIPAMRVPRYFISFVLPAALLVAACSPLPILNAAVPTDGYDRTIDIASAELNAVADFVRGP